MVLARLGMARQHQVAPVGGRHMEVDHRWMAGTSRRFRDVVRRGELRGRARVLQSPPSMANEAVYGAGIGGRNEPRAEVALVLGGARSGKSTFAEDGVTVGSSA